VAYDIIMGMDLMNSIGITVDCEQRCIRWGGTEIPLKTRTTLNDNEILHIEERWGSGMAGTFLNENEVRERAYRQSGTKKIHLVAFILDPRTKDLTGLIPAGDMIEIRDCIFVKIVNYGEKLNRENLK
jgi:hypothetical protein